MLPVANILMNVDSLQFIILDKFMDILVSSSEGTGKVCVFNYID